MDFTDEFLSQLSLVERLSLVSLALRAALASGDTDPKIERDLIDVADAIFSEALSSGLFDRLQSAGFIGNVPETIH